MKEKAVMEVGKGMMIENRQRNWFISSFVYYCFLTLSVGIFKQIDIHNLNFFEPINFSVFMYTGGVEIRSMNFI